MILFSLLLCILPAEPWPVDTVDLIEVNTVMDADGERRFTQVLWVDVGGPNEIVDWRFYCAQMLTQAGICLFEDKGRLRAVKVGYRKVLYSETYHDPEVERRKIQPLLWRRRLTDSPD